MIEETKYILHFPVYEYNTGQANNGNKIYDFLYDTKEEMEDNLKFINGIYEKIVEYGYDFEFESDSDCIRYESFKDLPCHQIAEAYYSIQTKKIYK